MMAPPPKVAPAGCLFGGGFEVLLLRKDEPRQKVLRPLDSDECEEDEDEREDWRELMTPTVWVTLSHQSRLICALLENILLA